MGRVINPEPARKQRQRLLRAVVLTLREMMAQTEQQEETRDQAAFLVLALREVAETIDRTVTPWEKRGYWLKADRFRMEWDWSSRLGDELARALLAADWGEVARVVGEIAARVRDVHVPRRHGLGRPWEGAWAHLQATAGGGAGGRGER